MDVDNESLCLSAGGMMPDKVGALIVAAGLSSRMNAFKPLLPLGDSTIIRKAIGNFHAARVEPVVVVAGFRADQLRAHIADTGVELLFNRDYATTDMYCSARIGFSHLRGRCRHLFFLPGDVPLFRAESLQRMSRRMEEVGADILVPVCMGIKGHPLLIDCRVMPQLLAYRGDQGLKGAIAPHRLRVEFLELDDEGVTMDADTPSDYQHLLAYFKNKYC